jgi:hypothetical protein
MPISGKTCIATCKHRADNSNVFEAPKVVGATLTWSRTLAGKLLQQSPLAALNS